MVPNSGRGRASRNDSGNLNQPRNVVAGGRIVPVAAGGRWIVVRRGRDERKIGLDGSFEAIREVIRCAFGLQTRQEFCLVDEFGIMRPLDRTMSPGIYELTVNPGVIMSFCYAKDPNHTECEVYTKTLATQADLSEFLEKNRWIGLRNPEEDENDEKEILDIMDDLQHDVVYHGLNKMQYP
ncbi:trihelix transcription factor GT-1-like [Apium graveolens]|uniref:trihelix transcription factor GT-1-like n=1 Tax=Apium graveolens TaxID=4045 RepID=UPI003D7C0875